MIERVGNCKILEEIATGGMSIIYKAVQEPLNRIVAIKALRTELTKHPQFIKRFEREAHFMSSFHHENIIHVYDLVLEKDAYFIIMEYIDGINLLNILEKNNILQAEVSSIIMLQIARALDYAHFRGIIHGDIKPSNIMISRQGEVKLIDFGIAYDNSKGEVRDSFIGIGTPSYMSPEQMIGSKVDYRTDIFSLGIVFYKMLSGEKPFFDGKDKNILQNINMNKYVPIRKINHKIPREIEKIISKCLKKLPGERYQSMQSIIFDMSCFLAKKVFINYNSYLMDYFSNIENNCKLC